MVHWLEEATMAPVKRIAAVPKASRSVSNFKRSLEGSRVLRLASGTAAILFKRSLISRQIRPAHQVTVI